ncbi:hypothetical protein GALMADRAFT_421840 [Galerina marginata CBS 339.88]|uniref:G domain-containing protein n=1 Tax=Galerina marginata (strain CBS 339.88) TaxID=685588 RepID=A0A067TAT3_GALM3|nr:hypothetical protein GALMADRAFT_421840 [Galerina marginata CBS 339.88]
MTESRQQSPPIQRSSDIYFRLLVKKGRGLPLWIPGSNQKLEIGYQRDGVSIGDVGIITASGSFDFLFNICVPHNHPFNPPELPENFIPLALLPYDVRQNREFDEASFLSSSSVKSRSGALNGFTFESSASEGAILTMPVGANSEDLANIAKFRKYMAANTEHWYRYILDVRGREPQNGDVLLVTGWDKTSAWGMATFSKATDEQEPFLLQFRTIDQGDAGITYDWEYSGSAEVRAGPGPREKARIRMGDPSQDGIEYENQCLFIRALAVDLQDKVWQKLASESGLAETGARSGHPFDASYSRSSREGSDRSSSSTNGYYHSSAPGMGHHLVSSIEDIPAHVRRNPDHLSFSEMIERPTKGINRILLKLNPTARMAITDDRDWISVIREDDIILPPADEMFKRILEAHIVCFEEDTVFLQPRDPSSQSASMASKNKFISAGTDSIMEGKDDNEGETGMTYISSPALEPFTDILSQECPPLRILVVGKSGAGKSTLINAVFGVDATPVSHKTPGEHDIDKPLTFPENDRIVIHDSRGFEAEEATNLQKVFDFIERRSKMPALSDRLHAIWLDQVK